MSYDDKKQFFANMLTIYGRKACEEALLDSSLPVYKLHLADSNKPAKIIEHCISLAKKRNIDVHYHGKRELSFISKNAKQDQGIALDLALANLNSIDSIDIEKHQRLILLDGVTNPQNLGMIIRSCAAGFVDGLILPEKNCAELGPLAIKASAGTVFKAPIFRCKTLAQAYEKLANYHCYALSLDAKKSLYEQNFDNASVFVLGNESTGISEISKQHCQHLAKIPMNNGVESLNVAVTASLIAFHPQFL